MDLLRPDLARHESYETAAAAVTGVEAAEAAAQASRGGLPPLQEEEEESDDEADPGDGAARGVLGNERPWIRVHLKDSSHMGRRSADRVVLCCSKEVFQLYSLMSK